MFCAGICHVLRSLPISDSMSCGSSCLMVWMPWNSPAGRLATRRTEAAVTVSAYPSSPTEAGAPLSLSTIAPGDVAVVETSIGNCVGRRICAASISAIAATSAFPGSTTMFEVRARSKGAPPVIVVDAGSGTRRGASTTGCGGGTALGRQAAPPRVATRTTRRSRWCSDSMPCMTPGLPRESLLGVIAELRSQNRKRITVLPSRLDEATAEHSLAVIEYHRLAGSDSRYRFVERDFELVAIQAHDLRPSQRRAVPHADAHSVAQSRRIGQPVYLSSNQSISE